MPDLGQTLPESSVNAALALLVIDSSSLTSSIRFVMPTQLEVLFDQMKALETELIEELQKQQEEFSYEIRKRGVYFEKTSFFGTRDMLNEY